MMYKLNMFLRKWKPYDNVYNFFTSNLMPILYVKTILFLVGLILCLFNGFILLEILQLIVYLALIFIEWFLAFYWYEKNEFITSYCSFVLMLFAFLLVIVSISNIIACI